VQNSVFEVLQAFAASLATDDGLKSQKNKKKRNSPLRPEGAGPLILGMHGSAPLVQQIETKLKSPLCKPLKAWPAREATASAVQRAVEHTNTGKMVCSSQRGARASELPRWIEQPKAALLPSEEASQGAGDAHLGRKVNKPGKTTGRPSKRKRSVPATEAAIEVVEHVNATSETRRQFTQPRHVEGVYVGEELYLRDPESDRVFAAVRDTSGDFIQVGRWLSASKSIDFAIVQSTVEDTQVCSCQMNAQQSSLVALCTGKYL
jgi:hypothetical protein